MLSAVLLLILVSAVTSGAQQRRAIPISGDKEAALGAAMAEDMLRQTAAVDDAVLNDYVTRLGNRLAATLPSKTWIFRVIGDEMGGSTREPISFPGGYVFVPVRLVVATETEAELAGMLAHSMAHTAERHWLQRGSPDLSSIPMIYVGGPSSHWPSGSSKVSRRRRSWQIAPRFKL